MLGAHDALRISDQGEADDPAGGGQAGGEEQAHPEAVEVERPADHGADPGGGEQRGDARDCVVDA
ncbi:MAG TPA: hypothetical protein VN213_00745 [Solirubrobacteraceae bacterium]|nr:hypothetical protein [Solirubrobacteraceae bacterium]